MSEEMSIDLNNLVGAIASVLIDPYATFVAKLHAEGRITDEEMAGLNQEIEESTPRLAELIRAGLPEDSDPELPPSRAGHA